MKDLCWKELMDITINFLDSIDLEKYIDTYDNVSDIIVALENDYNGSDILPKELDGYILKYMVISEFAEYLSNRYDLIIKREITVKFYVQRKKSN